MRLPRLADLTRRGPARPGGEEVADVHAGRDITRGYIDPAWYLQPQDKIIVLRGQSNYEIYEDLLTDDRVYSAFQQRRAAVVSKDWEVAPGGPRRRDRMAADWLRALMTRLRWDTLTDHMLYAVFYGYSVAELLYARDGAHVTVDRIAVRNRRRFVFDADFRPRLLTTDDPMGEPLPERKFWLAATGADNDDEPYGRGLASQLYWPVKFKKQGIKDWIVYLEKFGSPTSVGAYPPGASKRERDVLLAAARAVHTNTAITLPESMRLSLLEASRAGTPSYAELHQRMQDVITTIVLSQTMTTEDGASRAQADVHMEVRREVVEADARLIDDSWMRGPAAWLVQWNFPGAAVPRVTRRMRSEEDLARRAARDKTIAETGYRRDREYLEETYGVRLAAEAAPLGAPPSRRRPSGGPVALADPGEDDEDADPAAPLAARAGRELGPLVDAWVSRARAALEAAADGPAARRWLDERAQDDIDIAPVAERLALALAAAGLAGRFDVHDAPAPVALADPPPRPSATGAALPFRQAIAFFRGKLSLPTETWTDIWQEHHDVAFVVAGAARDDLLSDLRAGVGEFVEGGTRREFGKRFDAAVEKHGWDYKGGRDWRVRTIAHTNIRQARRAGSYAQQTAQAAHMPWWRYRHSPASEDPRQEHLAWDGLVLRHDDPWWRTHYPMNGWGCNCYVEALADGDLKRIGKTPDEAPPVNMRRVTVGRGAAARIVEAPEGVDPGFGYAPGRQAALGRAARDRVRKALAQEPAIAARGVAEALSNPRSLPALSAEWRRWRALRSGRKPAGEAFEAGALPLAVVDALRQRGDPPASAQVVVTDERLAHIERDRKRERGQGLDGADMDRLPEVLANPQAVLLDKEGKGRTLLFAFSPAEREAGKVVVRLDFREGKRPAANAVRSAGYVEAYNLRGPRYVPLAGEVR